MTTDPNVTMTTNEPKKAKRIGGLTVSASNEGPVFIADPLDRDPANGAWIDEAYRIEVAQELVSDRFMIVPVDPDEEFIITCPRCATPMDIQERFSKPVAPALDRAAVEAALECLVRAASQEMMDWFNGHSGASKQGVPDAKRRAIALIFPDGGGK